MASTWNVTTIDGVEYLVIDTAKFRIPMEWDPYSEMFIAVAAPTDGIGNFPALVQGDPGLPSTFDAPTMHPLATGDVTPDSVVQTMVSPGTDIAGPVYHQDFWLHVGKDGAPAPHTIMGSTDLTGTPIAKNVMVVNANANGFDYKPQLVGDRLVPATLNSTPSGNASYTLGVVSVPALPFAWRPHAEAQTILTGGGPNVRCDLVARLGDAVAGNVVGRGFGISGSVDRLAITPGPPAGSASGYDLVAAGSAGSVHLRIERQSGTDTFTTSASTTWFSVRVCPVL